MINFKGLTADRKRGNVIIVMTYNSRFKTGFKVPFSRLGFADDRKFKTFKKVSEKQRKQRADKIIPRAGKFI